MQNHVKNYLKHYGYDVTDFIPCEVCGDKSVDIHHIIYRSHFGKKEKGKQDDASNLIALCRSCHDKAHNEEFSKDYLRCRKLK